MSELLQTTAVEVMGCQEDCPCQSVHLVSFTDGDAFSSISLSPASARALAADLLSEADGAEARKLRIEGRLS